MTLWIHTLEGRTMSKESADHTTMSRFADQLDADADAGGERVDLETGWD